MIKLRDYQTILINKCYDAWQRVTNVLMVLPTGGGKTVIFSSIINEHNGHSAAVVHRKEILAQISLSLAHLGIKHRVVAPPRTKKQIRRRHYRVLKKSFIDDNAVHGVISVQTLTSRASARDIALQRWLNQVSLCVFDEGHHYVKQGIWSKAVELMVNARKLFVTATPERADGKGLGAHADGFCEEMIIGPSMQWLIDNKFLSRFVYKCPATDLDMSDLTVTASGDVNTKVLRARTVKSHLVGDVVTHYRKHALGKKCIVFASDVATAKEMATAYNEWGINAMMLHGGTDSGEREQALDRFENGSLNVLVNVDLFDEGFDVPGIEAVILARITFSLAKYLQMVGRALRILKSKTHAVVIDPVRNWERHGLPNWPRRWALDAKIKNENGKKPTSLRLCEYCTQPFPSYARVCPYCGAPVPAPIGRNTPAQVDGDLIELDIEAMSALLKRIDHAFLSDDEFKISLHTRHVPPAGHNRQIIAHQRTRYKREMLREYIGWWMGLQPADRPISERQRRFFHRFGVDVATALTLDENSTEQLYQQLKINFTEDLL